MAVVLGLVVRGTLEVSEHRLFALNVLESVPSLSPSVAPVPARATPEDMDVVRRRSGRPLSSAVTKKISG